MKGLRLLISIFLLFIVGEYSIDSKVIIRIKADDLKMANFLQMKIKEGIKTNMNLKANALQSTEKSEKEPNFIKITEGNTQTYSSCDKICKGYKKNTWYTEETTFPGIGKIFRCQCNRSYSNWHSYPELRDLGNNLFYGDSIFNHYFNMLGVGDENCQCNSLKELLHLLMYKQ